ncbi:hypothetical protein Amal_03729 [Acetobacter malorum]|uniref:Uncharacterized protein n=1 Tax=Acetobacter malorum TaxID=178901 RepID=A0A177G6E5_9PROT|nr:hypothetical protein Amal_03729 [Acetobacter malorum]
MRQHTESSLRGQSLHSQNKIRVRCGIIDDNHGNFTRRDGLLYCFKAVQRAGFIPIDRNDNRHLCLPAGNLRRPRHLILHRNRDKARKIIPRFYFFLFLNREGFGQSLHNLSG